LDKLDVKDWGSLPITVKLQNGSILYGSIVGFTPEQFGLMQYWVFLPNLNRLKYLETNDENLLITIPHDDINCIDSQKVVL